MKYLPVGLPASAGKVSQWIPPNWFPPIVQNLPAATSFIIPKDSDNVTHKEYADATLGLLANMDEKQKAFIYYVLYQDGMRFDDVVKTLNKIK